MDIDRVTWWLGDVLLFIMNHMPRANVLIWQKKVSFQNKIPFYVFCSNHEMKINFLMTWKISSLICIWFKWTINGYNKFIVPTQPYTSNGNSAIQKFGHDLFTFSVIWEVLWNDIKSLSTFSVRKKAQYKLLILYQPRDCGGVVKTSIAITSDNHQMTCEHLH